jgi:diguanylate cyclase (GGDEF)-like protein/PAS domain S-box-containing protein
MRLSRLLLPTSGATLFFNDMFSVQDRHCRSRQSGYQEVKFLHGPKPSPLLPGPNGHSSTPSTTRNANPGAVHPSGAGAPLRHTIVNPDTLGRVLQRAVEGGYTPAEPAPFTPLASCLQHVCCLLAILEAFERDSSNLEEALQTVVEMLPTGFRAFGATGAQLTLGDRTFRCFEFQQSDTLWAHPVTVADGRHDTLELHLDSDRNREEQADSYRMARDFFELLAEELAGLIARFRERMQIREEAAWWRSVTNELAEGIVIQDVDGTILHSNRSAQQLLGYSAEELRRRSSQGRAWTVKRQDGSRWPPEEHPAALTLRTGEPSHNVVMGVDRPDGSEAWILVNTQPLFGQGADGPRQVVISFRDITELRSVADALNREMDNAEQERRRLRAVLDALPVGVYIADRQGVIVESNAAGRKIWDWDRDDAPLGPERYGVFRARWSATGEPIGEDEWAMARALRHGETCRDEEIDIETFAGVRKTILNYALPFFDDDNQALGAVAVNVDITDRKQAELDRSRLAAVLDSSQEAILGKDLQGRITSWNTGAERLYGYRAEEVIGESVEIIIPPERRGEGIAILQRLLGGEEVRRHDTERMGKDGRRLFVSITVTPIRHDGQIIGALTVAHDVTERRELQARLEYDASHDNLTGAANRRLFMDRIEHVMAREQRHKTGYAVLMIDLDGFKRINDDLGHFAGDRYLVEAARRIQSCLRPEDTLARFGGDEFSVLLEGIAGMDDALQVCDRIHAALERPMALENQLRPIPASIGVALNPGTAQHAEELLQGADTALYRAKSHRKGGTEVFQRNIEVQWDVTVKD